MNKQTQLYLGLAAVAVGGFLLWKQSQKPKPATAVAASTAAPVAPEQAVVTENFAGQDKQDVVGNRMKMVGLVQENAQVTSSGWVRGADGSSIAPTFFDVQSSNWLRN